MFDLIDMILRFKTFDLPYDSFFPGSFVPCISVFMFINKLGDCLEQVLGEVQFISE